MNLLAFAATNSVHSINKTLVKWASHRFVTELNPDAEVTLLDLNDFDMPVYAIDRQMDTGIHPHAQKFFQHIGAADAIIVSFAEHNGLMTAAWKNLFDWMSRIDAQVWQGKSIAMFAATPGPRAGAGVLGTLAQLTPFFGGTIVGKHGVGEWNKAWDETAGDLTRDADKEAIMSALRALNETA
ncbi:MAG: NAD(P)H-dependent oxidoreductase [Pseudomonadota bacterium]